MSLGTNHTCGVSTSHKAYCWGQSSHGQLGDVQLDAMSLGHPLGWSCVDFVVVPSI
jgi:alpha-tubulin suppressor-like RCC1 family protein